MNKEELLNLIRIDDIIENYEEMLDCIYKLSKIKYDIQSEDLDLYTRCFKGFIGNKRQQFRKIEVLITKENYVDNNEHGYLLEIIEKKLAKEIIDLCYKVIEICDNSLEFNKDSLNIKNTLYFYKNKADHLRYIYEINEDNNIKNQTKEAYDLAFKYSKENKFLSNDIIYLTFYLNYSVFLHDVMGEADQAIKITKSCLNDAIKETEDIETINQKDIVLLSQMMKDNISLWKNEKPEILNI